MSELLAVKTFQICPNVIECNQYTPFLVISPVQCYANSGGSVCLDWPLLPCCNECCARLLAIKMLCETEVACELCFHVQQSRPVVMSIC
jgi:hypothetical protein